MKHVVSRALIAALAVWSGGCDGAEAPDASVALDAATDAAAPDGGLPDVDAGPDDAATADAGPPPECVDDEDCATYLCVDGRCTTTCRDACDCATGQACGASSHALPVCVPGDGACTPPTPACASPTFASTAFRNDVNRDMHDYALFLEDALRHGCEAVAAEGLRAKLRATLDVPTRTESLGRTVGPYQGWLEGVHVAYIATTASVLGGQGALDAGLDALVGEVRDHFVGNPTSIGLDPNCGLDDGRWVGGNACMDDFTVAAPAYAWLSAYERLRGRAHAAHASEAEALIASAFGPMSYCVHDPTRAMDAAGRGPCNATLADIGPGAARAVSLNHGAQNIAYGLGLMTLVGWAVTGLEVAGAPHVPTGSERIAADALMEEGQWATSGDGSAYRTDCFRFALAGGAVTTTRDADCGDAGLHYLPRMFHLAPLYERYYTAPPATVDDDGTLRSAYRYDTFDSSLFSDSPDVFFGPGRRLAYGTVGARWLIARPPMTGALAD